MRHRNHPTFASTCALAGVMLLLPAMVLWAQKVEFSGYGATGAAFIDRNPVAEFNQEYYFEGKFQVDIAVNKKIDAQLDFRGHSKDKAAVLREFSVKFDYVDLAKIKVGNIKKPFSLEGLADRDEYIPINDSYLHRRISELGYDGRNIGVMVYYNFKEKKPEYPFSYAVGAFRNQSYQSSVYARGSVHPGGGSFASVGYALLSRSHDDAITTHGLSIDAGIERAAYTGSIEAIYVQDPEEGIRRRLLGADDRVSTAGAKLLNAYRIDIGGEVVKLVEPWIMLGYFTPDLDASDTHTLELMLGINVFLDENVRARLSMDGLFSKDARADTYSTEGSSFGLELFVRY